MYSNYPHILHRIMYEIVLFGATGFTGNLCAHFIAQNYPLTTKWCIAAVSSKGHGTKFKRTLPKSSVPRYDSAANCHYPGRSNIHKDIEIIDLGHSSLKPLRQKTKVVINRIGLFHRFSTPIVAACATLGTTMLTCKSSPAPYKQLPKLIFALSPRFHGFKK